MAFTFNPFTSRLDRIQGLATLDARYVKVVGDTMTGKLTIGTTNTTGLEFGSLGTATRAIDFSSSGLSGGDYWLYSDTNEFWMSNGKFRTQVFQAWGLASYLQLDANSMFVTGADGFRLQCDSRYPYPIHVLKSFGEGNAGEIKIYGFAQGDSERILEIGVGIDDVADTASFDGLSNYMFDGDILSGSQSVVKEEHIPFVELAVAQAF